MDDNRLKHVTVGELLRPLRRNWGLVVAAFLGVVITVGILTLTAERVYESSAILSIREGRDVQSQVLNVPNVFAQEYLVKNQVAILESRSLASEIVKNLQRSVHRDSLAILGHPSKQSQVSIQNRILEWLGISSPSTEPPSFLKMVKTFQTATRVVYERETDIVELKGVSQNPWEAAFIVNAWVDVYQNYYRSDSRGEIIQTKGFLEGKLNEMKDQLSRSEERLAAYKKRNKVNSLSSETEQLVAQLSRFESLYNQTRTDLEAGQKQIDHLKDQLDESKQTLVEDMTKLSNTLLQELQKEMFQLVASKAAYEAQLIGAGYDLENDQRLEQMENRLKGLKDQIIVETKKLVTKDFKHLNPLDRSESLISQILELETTQEALAAKAQELRSIVNDYNRKLEDLPDKSLELARLERDVQVNSKLYIMLRENYEQVRIREAGLMSVSRIVDLAQPSTSPIKPKPALNMTLAVLFGMILGIGLALGRDYFEDVVRGNEDLKMMGFSVIGEVPALGKGKSRRSRHHGHRDWKILRAREIFPYMITHQNGNTSVGEAYRAIRTSIYLVNQRNRCRTILLTSPGPSEGKSTTAANLAIAMAQKGVKTLLVDSDLRKPVLDILFTGSERKIGLTNYLGKEVLWTEAVRETATKGLYLLSAGMGVSNASELLSSRRMYRLIEEAKEVFNIVLFDSPPMLPVADAMILASVVDGVVLVVKADKTKREGVRRSMDILENANANVLGALVTGVELHDLYGYRNYYASYVEKKHERKDV